MKQVRHTRTSKTGKTFFAGKRIPERYFVAREINKPQPAWSIKKPSDKQLTYYNLVEHRQYASAPYGDADKDGVINMLDFQPLNAQKHKTHPPSILKGNTKLTKGIGIFNLPRLYTCPGATTLCKKYCYAEGPERYRFGGVVFSRNRNYVWSKRPDFVKVMSETIKNMDLKWFRIHSSGDFYDQEYYNKWAEIARNTPNTKYLAYTKNWKLKLNHPKNLVVRYSSDISSEHIIKELPSCYTGVQSPKGFFRCKMKCEPGFCMACWDADTDVYIPIHSVSKKDVDHMFFKQFNPEIPPALLEKNKPTPNTNREYRKLYGLD
jgi:hypothetical protein